jgi:RNA ligase (TIGR02306 family)
MRKLASIQRIRALEPIEGADAIERATVLGWQLVVKKKEFQVGELCIYCEIDSILPEKPEFEFLKSRGMRIRTIRLRGQISQGICFPLAFLPEGTNIAEDADVTEILGVEKYEPPVPANLAGVMKGTFPSFIPKTDETRVQVLQSLLSKYVGTQCYLAEKLDGTSVTYYVNEGVFGVCSRNLELEEAEDNTLWKVARELEIENKLKSLGKNIAIQGEMIGEGIQNNKYQLKGQKPYFFNVFEIDSHTFLGFVDFQAFVKGFGWNTVPILDTNFELTDNIDNLVTLSIAKSVLNTKLHREGIVIRPFQEIINPRYGRVSFKAINPEFLLKYE